MPSRHGAVHLLFSPVEKGALTKLKQFNGNFVNAELVKAFITSTEHEQRFGP